MNNIRLCLSYDGTNYHGFQRQPEEHGFTVQGELEKAWLKLFGEQIAIITAGRTDKGVHAKGQVVNFNALVAIPERKIPKAMNSVLPRDIRILDASFVEKEFNARMWSNWKRYDYCIDNSPIYDVYSRLYSQHEPVLLDVEKMKQAAYLLEGTNNFRSFASAGSVAHSYVRTLYHCKVRVGNSKGRNIIITCIGNGFLYNMVRIIAGTLIYVGKGKYKPEDIPVILEKQDRTKAGKTASSSGLTLTYVNYDSKKPSELFSDINYNELEKKIVKKKYQIIDPNIHNVFE
ncbi:MAG: tRNA pseudouridine(38-40) synthase TruA [Eubacteriales bacterium]